MLRAIGRPVPDPVDGDAIIDTGAGRTTVRRGLLQPLGLPNVDYDRLGGLGADDGRPNARTYFVDVSFPGVAPIACDVREYLGDGLDLVDCLLGRDVLMSGRLDYNGRDGKFALTINGIDVPVD
jgi:hypothetical protein